ncbi:LTA synthase family protein [Paenibacillus sp. GCM10012303]|uniref:LTA synthase family protein n=1 Tax=Paenibacillus sp. GCM10012303 TaxID=3317340 RepID=UPI00360D2D2D
MGKWLGIAASYFKKRYMLLLLTGWLVLFMESISRNQIWGALSWSFLHIPAFVLNAVFIFGALLVLTSVTGRMRLSYWLVSATGFTLALISGVKLKMIGIPLLPWDFVLTGEASDMVEYLKNIFTVQLVTDVVIFFAVSWLLLYRTSHVVKVIRWKERLAFALLAVLFVAVVYWDKPLPVKAAFGIGPIPWDQSEHVGTNGLLLATVLNLDYMNVNKMEDYDSEKISAIVTAGTKPALPESSVKPNVIVVLSESLWDPTQLTTVKFSEDPMPFLHELQQKTASGSLLSPQFGGGTANVEFEVLSGNSMRFLPQGTIPYNQHITHGIDSIASIMSRKHGYHATAISPYHRWYFNSDKVYQNFGFSQYISLEFFNPVYEGPYIADSEVAKIIMDQTEKTAGRDFVFANTMQNHFHYYPGKFKENTISVEGDIPEDTRGILETYAQGAKGADDMLKTLVEHYQRSDEPTIIAFFGDHLPYLGDDYKAYKDTKWITGENDPDFLNKIYRTPLVVWSNYLPEQKEKLNMSPSFLGPYLLDKAKLSGNYYTDFLLELSKKYPVIPPQNYYAEMKIDFADIKRYEMLQYDIMFGERYAYGDLKSKIVNPNFVLGLGPMRIELVTPDKIKAGKETEITVRGANIPALGVVCANGKVLPTKPDETGALIAKLPADAWKSGTVDLQVKVIDSKEIIVAESAVYKLQSESK